MTSFRAMEFLAPHEVTQHTAETVADLLADHPDLLVMVAPESTVWPPPATPLPRRATPRWEK